MNVGTRGLRCGLCKSALATPSILIRLQKIEASLDEMLATARRFYVFADSALLDRLDFQRRLLNAIASDYSGYEHTRRSNIDLATRILHKMDILERRLRLTVSHVFVQMIIGLSHLLRITFNLPALPPGS